MSSNNAGKPILENSKQDTLNIITYSDIFQYPLTEEEIYERGKISTDELKSCLYTLISEKKIFLVDKYYSLKDNQELIKKRILRNKLATKFIPKAKFMTKIIANFPFTRGIFISGSLSKNCMDENSDIDFFIIAEPKRVWIVFLFCVLFRKIVLLNNSKYLCHNYIVDSDHMVIKEKSIYTAIEIRTLIPFYGYKYYEDLLQKNEWTKDYFPNYPIRINSDVYKKQPIIQKALELILNNRFGEWLDKRVLAFSVKRRKRKLAVKFLQYPNFYVDFQRHIAKEHLADYYPNVEKEYFKKTEKSIYQNISQ